ncbi:MAG: DegT/DnrJ/EryC1/StrS family aminotransferase [Acidobacteriaceae bacterium]
MLTNAESVVIPILDLSLQYKALRKDINAAIQQVLDSQTFILGPNVASLEREIAAFCNVQNAVGVASGTDALILALKAAGIGPGDEVIVPAFSFIASADAASLLGAIPIFADINPFTFTLDPISVAEKITPRTRAVIPVHLYGQPAEMDPLLDLATKNDIAVIEDAAQALGAKYRGSPVGSMGEFGCISFFPSKNLGGCGDGGMIVCRSAKQAERLRSLRSHGSKKKYYSDEQGFNSRLDEIQAAILRVKLPHLEFWNISRLEVAHMYEEVLNGIDHISLPSIRSDSTHVFHQYTIRVDSTRYDRGLVQQGLASRGIQTSVYYPVPLHLQKMYSHLGYRPGMLPVAEQAAAEVLSLPIYPGLQLAQITYIARSLREVLAGLN